MNVSSMHLCLSVVRHPMKCRMAQELVGVDKTIAHKKIWVIRDIGFSLPIGGAN